MGNDGGTIARGQDLRAVYSKSDHTRGPEHIDNLHLSLLSVCSLTSLPLYEHGHSNAVVSDCLGKLYLKEKLLEFLLSKKSRSSSAAKTSKLTHINGLGDFIDLHMTWSAQGAVTCPVTKTTKTQKSAFAYLRPCGCVFSNRLLNDLRAHRKVSENVADAAITDECPKCSTSFVLNYDVVVLNPESDVTIEAFNKSNIAYLNETLHVGHAKKPLKREKKKRREKGKEAGNYKTLGLEGKITKP